MDMPENEKVIEYLYAEALDRNNIKQAVAAKMRAVMPLHQKWQYIVQSWVTEEAVTKGVMPWIAVVTQWPATIKRLLEDRDMVDTEMGKTIEDYASRRNMLNQKNKTMLSSLSTTSTEWGPIVSKAKRAGTSLEIHGTRISSLASHLCGAQRYCQVDQDGCDICWTRDQDVAKS